MHTTAGKAPVAVVVAVVVAVAIHLLRSRTIPDIDVENPFGSCALHTREHVSETCALRCTSNCSSHTPTFLERTL